MRKLLASSLLALALSSVTFGGHIPNGATDPDPEPSPTPSGIVQETADAAFTNEQAVVISAEQLAFSLLQSILNLF